MPRKPKNPNRGLRWGGGSVRQRGNKWEARWWDGDVHRSKSFDTEPEAWDHLIDIERGRARSRPDRLTVEEMVEWMLDHADGRLATGSIFKYRRHAKQAIYPKLGNRQAAELEPYDLQRWLDGLKDQYSPGSRRFALAILSSAYTEARRLKLVSENPCSGVRRPASPRRTPAVWTLEEAQRVIEAADANPIYGALYLVALVTGMRPGELCALQWSAVDLDQGVILVQSTMARSESGAMVIQPTTKGKEPRYVLIAPIVVDRLKDHQQAQATRRKGCDEWHEHGLVFDRGDGGWIDNATWNVFNRRLCKRLGVTEIPPHGLRHTSATWDLDANTHGKVVSERLGHKDPAFTMRFYQHVRKPVAADAANALTDRLAGTPATSLTMISRSHHSSSRGLRNRPAPRVIRR